MRMYAYAHSLTLTYTHSGGKFYYCSDPSVVDKASCSGSFTSDSGPALRVWRNPPQNFDNIGESMLTMFQIATLSSWSNIAYMAVDANNEPEMPPIYNNNPVYVFFFIGFIIICSFFTLNLFVGVVIDNFNRLKQEYDGSALLTEEQMKELKTEKLIRTLKINPDDTPPFSREWAMGGCLKTTGLRLMAYKIVKHGSFDAVVMGFILANTLTMAMVYDGMSDAYESVLDGFNLLFASIFLLEAILKITGLHFMPYWAKPWNKFGMCGEHSA
jgi:hypothetical protein